MNKIWYLVADSSRARLLEADGLRSPLTEVRDFVNPDDRLREQDLVEGEPGRVMDRGHVGNYGLGEQGGARKQATERFARELCAALDEGSRQHHYAKLYISAAPDVLGLIRHHLSPETRKRVDGELNLDIVRLPPQEIRKHFAAH